MRRRFENLSDEQREQLRQASEARRQAQEAADRGTAQQRDGRGPAGGGTRAGGDRS
jgi:hypothetical protein